jgi:hypothetical protein
MNSLKNKIHNFILKAITVVAVMVLIFCACSVDSMEILLPTLLMTFSTLWLFLFGLANNWFEERK